VTDSYPRGTCVYVSAANHGCELNMLFVTRVIGFLERNGHPVVQDPCGADVILVAGCGAYAPDIRHGLTKVRDLALAAPQADLRPMGCLGRIGEVLTSEPHRDRFGRLLHVPELDGTGLLESTRPFFAGPTIGQGDAGALEQMFEHDVPVSDVPDGVVAPRILDECGDTQPADRLMVTVAEGCVHHCTYCSIRTAKGHVRSRPAEGVVGAVRDGLSKGFKEFILMGDDCGSYGADRGTTFAELVNRLAHEVPDALLHFYEVYPQKLIDLAPHIEEVTWRRTFGMTSPLQHTSPRILRLMGRQTDLDAFGALLRRLRGDHPGLYLHGHLIYGFPTETREEFEGLLQVKDLYHTIKFNRYRQTVVTKLPLLSDEEVVWREERLAAMGIQDGFWSPQPAPHKLVGALHAVRKGADDIPQLHRAVGASLQSVLESTPDERTRRLAERLLAQLSTDPSEPPAPAFALCAPKHLSVTHGADGTLTVRNFALREPATVTLAPDDFAVLHAFETPATLQQVSDAVLGGGDGGSAALEEAVSRMIGQGLLVPA
jgi:ribosomal protein S12 methylthiotransferase